MNNKQKEFLTHLNQNDWEAFLLHLDTDENADYRRGFYAGKLFAGLQYKNQLTRLEGANNEQSE